ncbi:phage holin family protein [Desulfitobacterium metallireducens]|uniref:Membrane protein n=1 Tax=Desulfitobacterium metallireducens DSM 15288 TaxID=871968 RepID=W0EBK8_9FIRM|nr:phage holin family protein [Desulfitobacterium metallireducens]AHF08230.1 membrane protein [Desulfitobacterium metallireducens DSM 15288]
MTGFLTRLLINALAFLITPFFIPGFYLEGVSAAIFAALVWGMINTLIRPLFSFFTFPLQILSLGIFTLVINALMLVLTATLVPGFSILSFSSAFFGAIILSFVSMVLTHLFK